MFDLLSMLWRPAAVIAAAAILIRYAYLLWFHPLSKYPGPKLAACTELWYAKTFTGGRWHKVLIDAHRRYGDVIRIAPNELSFVSVQAYKDIYGPPSKTRKLFPKSPLFYDTGVQSIVYEMSPEAHEEQHKLFSPAFRPSAVRSQEHVVQEHVDLFIAQLRDQGQSGLVGLDVTTWMEWLVFDVIGDLAFGESFGAIRAGKQNYWVTLLHGAVYGASVALLRHRLAILGPLLRWAPAFSQKAADAVKDTQRHGALTLEKTRARVKMGNRKGVEDFLEPAIGVLTEPQLVDQAYIFLTAGAETSATVLAAAVWFLSAPQNARTLAKLQDEVRTTFAAYDAITGDEAARLPYLNAVLEETMRVVPPAGLGSPRVSPGETVHGDYIPAGVFVSVDSWSMNHDPRNAADPDTFRPERWLAGGERPYSQPFLIGPRSCIGVNLAWLEMRITLAKLVYSFDWKLAPESLGRDWLEACQMLVLWKKPKLMVEFKPVAERG